MPNQVNDNLAKCTIKRLPDDTSFQSKKSRTLNRELDNTILGLKTAKKQFGRLQKSCWPNKFMYDMPILAKLSDTMPKWQP